MNSNSFSLSEKSLLSREQSAIIKGIAIFAVVASHNILLTAGIQNLWLFLNSFNVAIFFIIVGLYGVKETSFIENLKNTFVKIYLVYAIALLIYFLLYKFVENQNKTFSDYIVALFIGGGKHVKNATGFLMLWFLPAFFWFSIFHQSLLKLFFSKKHKQTILAIVLFIPICLFTLYILWEHSYFYYFDLNSPLAGIFFIPFSIITSIIVRTSPLIFSFIFSVIVIILFVLFCFLHIGFIPEYLMPLAATIFTLGLVRYNIITKKQVVGKIFSILGKNSLYIYLTHSLVFYSLYRFFNVPISNNIIKGIIFLIITIATSTILSVFIKRGLSHITIFRKNDTSKEGR